MSKLTVEVVKTLERRGTDPAGSGAYGAGRAGRTHYGIDFATEPGEAVLSPVSGVVTKVGYCYGDDLSYRYVRVMDPQGAEWRIMYVKPFAKVGEYVSKGITSLGLAQNLLRRVGRSGTTYGEQGMTNHIHVDKKVNGSFVDPDGE